jgi:hypothetical protein
MLLGLATEPDLILLGLTALLDLNDIGYGCKPDPIAGGLTAKPNLTCFRSDSGLVSKPNSITMGLTIKIDSIIFYIKNRKNNAISNIFLQKNSIDKQYYL